MRHIGNLPSQEQAEMLVGWFVAERIDVFVDPHGGRWELWVKDEDQLNRARTAYQEFVAAPEHPRYREARERALAVVQEKRQKQKEFSRNYVDVRRGPRARVHAPLTWTIIAITSVVAVLTNFGREDQLAQSPITALALMAAPPPQSFELLKEYSGDTQALGLKFVNIRAGEVWRLITPIFIHFGTMHLIFNMVIVFQLGRMVEGRYGAFRYGLIVLAIAAISNGVQGAVPVNWGGISAGMKADVLLVALGGMSGVCYGLFGLVWIKSILEPGRGFYLPQSSIVIMLGWLFFCMSPWSAQYLGFAVANWAHGIGLVMGMALAYLTHVARRM